MNVLFVTPAYIPVLGGGERYVRSLAVELVRRKHHVTVVTSLARNEQAFWQGTTERNVITEQLDGVQIIRCPLRPFPGGHSGLIAWRRSMVLISALPGNQTAVLQKMAQLIPPLSNLPKTLANLSDTFDVIHGFNISWEYPLLCGQQWAQQQRRPFVVTPFIHLGTPGQRQGARNNTMAHQQHLLTAADAVLTLTTTALNGLHALKIPLPQTAVIGGGLDPILPVPNSDKLVHQLGLTQPFILYIGRTSYDKGVIHALKAVSQLITQNQPVTLAIAGHPTPEFERAYNRLDETVRPWVRPLGQVSEAEKHALLQKARFLLLPSRVDSFGIVLLEAWAHQKPVIGADSGGIPGVISAGKDGLLIPFADVPALAGAISQLWQNETLRQKMGQCGQQKVNTHYTWPQVGERVLKSYRQLLPE